MRRSLAQEGGAGAVKLEGGVTRADTIAAIVNMGSVRRLHAQVRQASCRLEGDHRRRGPCLYGSGADRSLPGRAAHLHTSARGDPEWASSSCTMEGRLASRLWYRFKIS